MQAHGKVAKSNVVAMPVIKLVALVKDIEKRTTALVGSLKTQQTEMHTLAVSVLMHVAKHGNIDVLTNFLKSVKDVPMVRNNALGNWFEKFGPVYYETDKTKGKGWKLDTDKRKPFLEATKDLKAQREMLDNASKSPFWNMKGNEGGEYVKFDTLKGIDMLIGQLQRDMLAAKKHGQDVDHSATITALKLAKIKAGSPATGNFADPKSTDDPLADYNPSMAATA